MYFVCACVCVCVSQTGPISSQKLFNPIKAINKFEDFSPSLPLSLSLSPVSETLLAWRRVRTKSYSLLGYSNVCVCVCVCVDVLHQKFVCILDQDQFGSSRRSFPIPSFLSLSLSPLPVEIPRVLLSWITVGGERG